MKALLCRLVIGIAPLALLLAGQAQAATGFTPYAMNFSGYLEQNAVPASGTFPMRFSLLVSGTSVWCEELTGVSVNNGDFSVALGSSSDPQGPEGYDPSCTTLTPSDLSLDPTLVSSVSSATPVTVAVWVYDGSSWEALTPDISVSSSIFALQADTAQTAASATTASQLQGVAVSSTAPTDGQVLQYNSAASQWAPASSSAGTPGGSNGQVQFDSSGSFGGSAKLTWDNTNFRLGVGAITPSAQLDVSGFGANASGTFRVYDQSASGVTQEIVKAGASQSTTNLTTWQSNLGATQASMSASGGLTANSVTLAQGSGELVLQEATGGASSITWKLPEANASGYLENDGSGNLSWGSVSSGTVTSVSATAPLSSSGGTTPAISLTNGASSGDILYWNGTAWSSGLVSQDVVLSGSGAATVKGIQTVPISATAPTGTNNLLYYNGTEWEAASPLTAGLATASQLSTLTSESVPLGGTGSSPMTGALGVNTPVTADSLAQILDATGLATNKALVIQGATSQTANLTEWQNSSGIPLITVDSSGDLQLASTSSLTLSGMTQGSLLFMGASGVVSQDNAKLKWSDSATELGIGAAPVSGSVVNIASVAQSATDNYGLTVNAPTGGTSDYAASFIGGNVGVGTTSPGTMLDVNGGVRAGAATVVTATCNGTNEGIQRYNYTSHSMEYCNGTAWTALGTMPAQMYVPSSVVYSATTTTGNGGGYSGMNALCSTGYHMCTANDIALAKEYSVPVPATSIAWYSSGLLSDDQDGNEIVDCASWTTASASLSGPTWDQNNTTTGDPDYYYCSYSNYVLCCK